LCDVNKKGGKMKKLILSGMLVLAVAFGSAVLSNYVSGQNAPGTGSATTTVQATTPWFAAIPISATAAVNTQTTLTIPAPAVGNVYNYVCSLALEANQNATSTAITNATTSSTNFNGWASKFSLPATANLDSGVMTYIVASPATGCVKSAVAGTATTFVSPAATANAAFTWYATYYQAP
jgi:hypothetical protein